MTKKKNEEVEPSPSLDDDEIIELTQLNNIIDGSLSQDEVEASQKFNEKNNYKSLYKDGSKMRAVTAVCYPESLIRVGRIKKKDEARSYVQKQFEMTGLPVSISPLHDNDDDGVGGKKKEHFHLLTNYPGGSTTYKNWCSIIRPITLGPFPLRVMSIKGMYDYLTHKNNPEKAQYDPKDIITVNGFVVPLGQEDKQLILNEVEEFIIEHDILSYTELMYKNAMDEDRKTVIRQYHSHLKDVISGMFEHYYEAIEAYSLNAPIAVRKRLMSDEEMAKRAEKRLKITLKRRLKELECDKFVNEYLSEAIEKDRYIFTNALDSIIGGHKNEN